ncbi:MULTISPECIES: hypothetical protein [Streptomyces]|uniref:hypothetical protein n=1 Tax=Streptomyces TaxID=1883 RepID=UPI000689EE50|nr:MULTISPECIES: hypothetical protein [Streptomyces]
MYPTLFTTPGLTHFAQELDAERGRQLQKWGDQRHRDGTNLANDGWAAHAKAQCQNAADEDRLTWAHILQEEFTEVMAETNPARLRAELIQVAAVCAAWVSDLDRRPRPGATVSAPSPRPLAACGTNAAYKRHVRKREPIDPACRAAHTRADRATRGAEGPPVQAMAADPTQWTAGERRAAITVAAHVRAGEVRDVLILLGLLPPEGP